MKSMRVIVKPLIRFLKLGRFLRQARMLGWSLFDFLGTLVFALARVLGWVSAVKPFEASQVKKILIIRLDRLGDVILSTPAIHAVRQRFPQAQIDLLVNVYAREIVSGIPWVNRVLVYKKDVLSRDYDLAICLQPGLERNQLAFLSGAKWRAGYRGWGGGFFLTRAAIDDRQTRVRHEVESALEIAGIFGCSIEEKALHISASPEGEEFAQRFYCEANLEAPVIFIHPGSRQEYIRWKKERFAEVADRLVQEKHASVILTGGKEEQDLVREVAALMKEKKTIAVGLALSQLVSLIKKSDLFIGNSTGPMHIAAALQVPVVAIFGCRHPLDSFQEWGPWGGKSIVVSKDLGCPQCHPSDCLNFGCLAAVTAEDVYQAAIQFL
jgi:ADP-heptose:LPS heptosyltransferase